MKLLKITFTIFTLVTGLLMQSTVQAQDLVQRNGPRSMRGVRALGMGDAFVAIKGTDENAIWYNPAAINDYDTHPEFQFLLPTVEFSYKAINFFASDLKDLASDISDATTDRAKIDRFDQFAASNTGRYEEVGVRGNLVTMMHKYITASLFYESNGVIALTNAASSTIDIEVLSQVGLNVGTAYSFFDDHLQAGIGVKFIERHLIDQTLTQRDIVVNDDFGDNFQLKQFGFGIGVDFGLKGKLPIDTELWNKLDPTFAVTIQDIGDTRFFAGDPVGKQKQSTTFGTAISPKIGPFETNFAMDIRDLEYRTDFLNKFHFGTEWVLADISKVLRSVSLRAGFNQAYWTAGFGLDFKYFKLNAATYGREIARNTIQKESRMFSFQLAAGF